MKKWILSVITLTLTLSTQAQELPQPSPTATLNQRIGLTDFTVTYSRPSAKGRKIFGDLVPYGEVWRTGANACTKITSSTPFKIGGEEIDAGEYALFTIPGKKEWTVIVSKQTNLWGSSGYNESEDVARFIATPVKSEFDESFAIEFDAFTTSGANMSFEWEDVSVRIPISVDSEAQSEENILGALATAYTSYRNAADYYSKHGNHEKALELINTALHINTNNWYTHWIKAQILHESGDLEAALAEGEKAVEMGQASYDSRGLPFNYRAGIEKDMKSWK